MINETNDYTMMRILERVIEGEHSNGLFLLPLPTGFGKTHFVTDYIFNSCMDEKNRKQRYVYITTLKKNLCTKALRDRFVAAKKELLFEEKVLFLDSNRDSLLHGFDKLTNEMKTDIPDCIKKHTEYDDIQFLVETIRKSRDKEEMKGSLVRYMKEIDKVESKFRRVISQELSKAYRTEKEKICAIKTDNSWKWVGMLYPAVFWKERQVFLMSMDKFLTRNRPIIGESYTFCKSDIFKNAIVFIDEFDATKDTILKKIIEEELKNKIEDIDLFRQIHSTLNTAVFPSALTIPSKQYRKKKYSLSMLVKKLREMANVRFKEFSLQFVYRTKEHSR